MNFSVEESNVDGFTRYLVRGYVNENAVFPKLKTSPVTRIDLGEVTGLNSIGTRNWCDWVGRVKSPDTIFIERAPAIFIKSFNHVVGALNSNMRVVSFYVPYVSTTSGKRHDLLCNREDVYKNEKIEIAENIKENNEDFELDVLNEYFEFLKKNENNI